MSDIDLVGPNPEPGGVDRVAPGVWRAALPVPFPPRSVNAYLLEDVVGGREGWTVVDPGLKIAGDAWDALLAEPPLAGRPVLRVVATHHHPDHIGAAGLLMARHGAELWTTRTAWLFARMLQLDGWSEPPAEAETFYRRAGYDAPMLERWRLRARINFSVTVAPLPLGFRRLTEGDVVAIGARRFRVAVGHGHAPEHALLVSETDDLALVGDQVLPKISPNISVYPTEPCDDPLGDWMRSCRRLPSVLGERRLILPGHGPAFRGAPERLAAMFDEHEARLEALEAFLRTPRRAVDCFEALFSRPIPPAAEGLATGETLAHLAHLEAIGRAARETEDGVDIWRRTG